MNTTIPQVHLTNVPKIKGHSELNFANSAFLISYNSKLIGCTNYLLFSSHFGISPGVNEKSAMPGMIEEWLLCPRKVKKSLFKTSPILADPIKVIGYPNIASPTELLLLDLEFTTGNYDGVQISPEGTTVNAGDEILFITCPKDRTDITQNGYSGKVHSIDSNGFFTIVLDEDIPLNSTFGSPVLDAETGLLIGVVSRYASVDGKKCIAAAGIRVIREDLEALYGPEQTSQVGDTPTTEGQEITLSIDIAGDGFANEKEMALRLEVENVIEQKGIGVVREAGSGMGKMQITVMLTSDVNDLKQVLEDFNIAGSTEIID